VVWIDGRRVIRADEVEIVSRLPEVDVLVTMAFTPEVGAVGRRLRLVQVLEAGLRQGRWESQWAVSTPPPAPWPELAGKILGILGYGRIGQCVARRAQTFDMAVWATRRDIKRSDAHGLAFLGGPDALDEVLRRADDPTITPSLIEATRGLLGERELRLAKLIAENIHRAGQGEPPLNLIPASAE
jgi:phosphoglycerate dehydrogenase-like enzyme